MLMKPNKDKTDILLSGGRVCLETGVFELTAEEQRLMIILLISNARDMGRSEQATANSVLATLLRNQSAIALLQNATVH
jgi:hypothetical protein